MKHYDEHTIELFALDSKGISHQKEEIAKHLKECFSCNELFEEISQFYEMSNNQNLIVSQNESYEQENSLVVNPQYVESSKYSIKTIFKDTLPFKIWQFAKQRPIASSASVIAFAAILTLFVVKKSGIDENPFNYILNDNESRIEIYNKESEKLWQLNWFDNKKWNVIELIYNVKLTQVNDINNDGKNEILSIIPQLNSKDEQGTYLNVYNLKKEKIFSVKLGNEISFENKKYNDLFSPTGLIVDDFNNDGEKEILVGLYHTTSISVILRLNYKGETLGEYWHVGRIFSMGLDYIGQGRQKSLIIGGIDDVSKAPFVSVIDPTKIIGSTHSTATKGFDNIQLSEAEIFYISFPSTSLDTIIFHKKPRLNKILTSSSNEIEFEIGQDVAYADNPQIIYSFNKKNLTLEKIIPTDQTRNLYKQNKAKLTRKLDNNYIETLRKNIKYWDGKEWKNEVVRVTRR